MSATAHCRADFWRAYQPGFRLTREPVGSSGFYAEIERRRYELEPDILEMARFSSWRGRDGLEVGCGIATDGKQFATAGARYTGVDASPTAIALADERLERDGIPGRFVQCSITNPPFRDQSFDLVYSMGVKSSRP